MDKSDKTVKKVCHENSKSFKILINTYRTYD